MSKIDVLNIFEDDIENPGSYKSGNYLDELILKHSEIIIKNDKQGLLDVLHDWINIQSEPRTMLAVKICNHLKLIEMVPHIKKLKKLICNSSKFPEFYLQIIDETLLKIAYKD